MTGNGHSLAAGAFGKTMLVVGLAILAIFFLDTVLARSEMAESRTEGARAYAAGQAALQAGKNEEAADHFKSAIAAQRGNQEYHLALAQALLAARELDDAEDELNEMLQSNPLDSRTNLAMARVLGKQGKFDDSAIYYHRAIYGQWKEDPLDNQVKVRFELTDLLSKEGSKEALLAELLLLENDAPDDAATRKKLGKLFIVAGSPARAAEIFRGMLRTDGQDAEVYAGLGEAEFARGNYRAAQTEFATALRLNPDNDEARQRFDLSGQVLGLDPASRGLSIEEQFRRSRKLAQMALDDITRCIVGNATEATRQLMETVAAGLTKPVTAERNALVENNLDWADKVWLARKAECKKPVTAEEQPMALVLAMPAR
jgi:tetratricopeptide (TPR) repeat protein